MAKKVKKKVVKKESKPKEDKLKVIGSLDDVLKASFKTVNKK